MTMERLWEKRWNLARVLAKDQKENPRVQQLIEEADFVLECGEYLVLFKEKHKTKRIAFQVRMPDEMVSALKRLSAEEVASISDLVNEIIMNYTGMPPALSWKRKVGGKAVMLYLEKEVMKKIDALAEELRASKAEVVRSILEDRLSAIR